MKLAILGSGQGTNCQAIIDAVESGILEAEIKCVLSDNHDAFILKRAKRHRIPAFHFDCAPFKIQLAGASEQELIRILEKHDVDFIALAGFMRIIKSGLLHAYAGCVTNIHPSLLPSFPGLNGCGKSFEYGVKFTGCTVHFVDEGIDTGPIVNQRIVSIENDDTPENIREKVRIQEHIAYPEALQWIARKRLVFNGRRIRLREACE